MTPRVGIVFLSLSIGVDVFRSCVAIHDRRFCDLGKIRGESPDSRKYDGRLELTVFIKMYNLILCANYTIYKEGGNHYTGLSNRIL